MSDPDPPPPSPSLAEVLNALPAAAEAMEALLDQVPLTLERLRAAERALLVLILDGIPAHAFEAVEAWQQAARAQREALGVK